MGRVGGFSREMVWGLVLLALFLWATPVVRAAQVEEPVLFDHLTVNDGLSEGTVRSIVQDELGFLWFATQNGLNKYDGYSFTVYQHDPDDPNSLSESNLRSLLLTQDGALWIGTVGGGLNRLDRTTNTFSYYRHDPADPNSLASDMVFSLYQDSAGLLWIGGDNGLTRFDPAAATFTHYSPPGEPAITVNAIVPDPAGLWLATTTGLTFFDSSSEAFTSYHHDPDDPTTISHEVIIALIHSRDGHLWVGTVGGLSEFDPVRGTAVRYPADPDDPDRLQADFVAGLYEDRAGNLWVGTNGGGLSRLDRDNGRFTTYRANPDDPTALSGDAVTTIYEDRSGILWLGTWAADLNLIDPLRHKFPPAIPAASPLAITSSADGTLWSGMLGEGLVHFSAEGELLASYRHDPADPTTIDDDQVFALLAAGPESLWVGTSMGLNRLELSSGTFRSYPPAEGDAAGQDLPAIRTLYEDRRGRIWIGSDYGLNYLGEDGLVRRYQPATGSGLTDPSGLAILDIREDEAGILWLGSSVGLLRLDPGSGRLDQHDSNSAEPGSANAATVTVVHPGRDGTLWLGTWGSGLRHYDPGSGQVIPYQERPGIPANVILGILEDRSGRLWLSSTNGLIRFDPVSGEVRTFDRADGLTRSDFYQGAYYQSESGAFYFGAADSIVHFFPENIGDNPLPPPVVLTGFQLFNQPVAIGDDGSLTQHPNYVTDLRLSYRESVFSFDFAALNFTNSQKNQYAYRMEGFDPDWNYVGNRRSATYTNLDPGRYTFRVIAANNDGLWNNEGLTIDLTITPPWWRTWWAYALYVAAVTGLVLAYANYRTQTQARELARERRLREQLERVDRLKDEDRARIARDMHDGLAQTLAGLRFRALVWQTLLNSNPTSLPAEFDELGRILDESIQDVRRSIFALRPTNLAEMGFWPALEQFAANLSHQYQLPIEVELPRPVPALPANVEDTLFRVAQELLHNAVRHAQAGRVWLSLAVEGQTICLTVGDDGVGFDPASLDGLVEAGHFGLRQLGERVAMLKGNLAIDSGHGRGTRIEVKLPLV